MGDELLLEDEVSLVDVLQVPAIDPQDGVVVPMGRGAASVDVGEDLVVELDLARVE